MRKQKFYILVKHVMEKEGQQVVIIGNLNKTNYE